MKIEAVAKLSPLSRLTYWIQEREQIRKCKESKLPRPWTADTILHTYRFCNVRRMDDKVSKWLLDNWYVPYFDHPNMLQAVGLARFINLPESLALLTDLIFQDTINWKSIKTVLRKRKESGHTLFNGAYMVRGNDGQDKVASVVDYYVASLKDIAIDPSSMEGTHARLLKAYGMGSFMAGQIVADLRWAVKGVWRDRKTWAPIGPGSKRGMNRLQGLPLNSPLSQEEFLEKLRTLWYDLNERAKTEALNAILKRLELMDVQNCLCEFDKYERTLFDGRKPKQLYRVLQ